MLHRSFKLFCKIYLSLLTISFVLYNGCSESDDPFPNATSQNINSHQLAEAYEIARNIDGMRSLLLERNEVLVSEEYFNGVGPDDVYDVRSVTKSFTSALIGIAIEKGFIQSVDETIADYFTNVEVDSLPERKGNITIRQLLTMTCGMEWHELGGYSEFSQWVNSPDQINYIIAKPFTSVPGTHFNYSDGAAHLTSVILEEAVGMGTVDFANQYLFNPLGLGEKTWWADNRGYNYGGVGLCVTPRDMIKFGRLYLNHGVYNGQQIIPVSWVNESTQTHISTNNVVPYGSSYGYYWWIANERGHYIFYATGYGGQFIFCVPDLNLVTVATCNWQNTGVHADEHWYAIIQMFMNNILPAVNPNYLIP